MIRELGISMVLPLEQTRVATHGAELQVSEYVTFLGHCYGMRVH